MKIEHSANNDDLNQLRTPQPVISTRDEEWLILSKGGAIICKFNVEDRDALFSAVRLLGGIVANRLVLGEVEQLRDLILMETGS